jgi:tetratricopeptide (TPR) repeat protein
VNKQSLLALGGLALVIFLFIFGRTSQKKKPLLAAKDAPAFNIISYIDSSTRQLTPNQAIYVSKLKNNISRGDIPAQQISAYNSLASFWRDSIKAFEPYAYYTVEAAKLENSEKTLTFAAHLLLDDLRHENNEALLEWKTSEAITLFEKAISLNQNNDDLRIGLGSVYVYGKGRSGNAEATMKGIQQLLSVVRKDSNNIEAQMVLGVGGLISGQYDKALERFKKIVQLQPGNLEAVAYLADTYAAKGEKAEAIKWYNRGKLLANDPHYSEEADKRIRQLRK